MPVKGKTAVARPSSLPYRALGAYIFAGGFTVGVSRHFDVKCHLEGNNYGVPVVKRNFPDLPVHVGVGNWPVDELAGEKWDFIYGNPPCAAWSANNPKSHGKQNDGGWENDPRVNCTRTFFGLLGKLKPTVWAWESVCQAPDKGKPFVDELTRAAIALGYSVSQVFHDAQYLGVPQVRRRWFLVCHKVELAFVPPAFGSVMTAAAALKNIKPRGKPAYDGRSHVQFDKYLPKIKPGTRLRHFWEEHVCPPEKQVLSAAGVKGRCGQGHIRLRPDRPAVGTVGYAMCHPTQHRFLHINEVQALAGFPQAYVIDRGTKWGSAELDLIARGVCPPVGEWLAKSVKASLDRRIYVKKPTVTIFDFRKPGIAPVDVTAQYRK